MIRICISDDFTVDYDEESAMYRVSVLGEDAKTVNEYCFDAYKDEAVRHGKWEWVTIDRVYHCRCSMCGGLALYDECAFHEKSLYCPNCGAKMECE